MWPVINKSVTLLLFDVQSAKEQVLVVVNLISFFSGQFYAKKRIKGHSVTYCIFLQMIKYQHDSNFLKI